MIRREDDIPADDGAVHFVQAKFERRDDAEITATTANAPEQVRIFIRTGVPQHAVRGYDVHALDVIECQAVLSRESAEAAAK